MWAAGGSVMPSPVTTEAPDETPRRRGVGVPLMAILIGLALILTAGANILKLLPSASPAPSPTAAATSPALAAGAASASPNLAPTASGTPGTPAPSDTPNATPTPPSDASPSTSPTSPSPTPKSAQRYVQHKVLAGETLSSLAKKYGVTVQAIAKANGLKNQDVILVGQKLRIPVPAAYPAASPSPRLASPSPRP